MKNMDVLACHHTDLIHIFERGRHSPVLGRDHRASSRNELDAPNRRDHGSNTVTAMSMGWTAQAPLGGVGQRACAVVRPAASARNSAKGTAGELGPKSTVCRTLWFATTPGTRRGVGAELVDGAAGCPCRRGGARALPSRY